MKSLQQLKAEARKSAKAAPKADLKIAEAAKAEANSVKTGNGQAQPVYATQTKPSGEVIHRGSGVPMSEFSDPAAHTVRAAKKLSKES